MFIRTPYNYDTMEASDESGLLCEDPSLAVQSSADEQDINKILERYALTGQLPGQPQYEPTYGDFTGIGDFHAAMNTVRAAEEAFMTQDALVRARFNNDPGAFLRFFQDPANQEEAIKLGLATRKEDLSTGAPERAPHAGGGAPVGKSGQQAPDSKKGIFSRSRGNQGDEGED